MTPLNRLLGTLLRVLVMLVVVAVPAFAKEAAERLPPYDVDGLKHTKVWVPWVFAFFFAVACLATAFKNPHRSSTER